MVNSNKARKHVNEAKYKKILTSSPFKIKNLKKLQIYLVEKI